MGCGISPGGPQVPLYINEFSPPSHELVGIHTAYPENFPPSGIVSNENGSFFDDREFIKQCQIVHIHELIVYFEQFVSGIEILYYLDGGIKTVKHCGSKGGKKHVLPIQNTDSIVVCEGSYENNKIYSIRIQTLQGRVLDLVGNNGLGNHKFSLKLNQQKRAIVGFKGKIGEYIEGLIVYSWKLREKSRK